MVIIVNKCSDCPFYDQQWAECNQGAELVSSLNYSKGPPPNDCPLTSESIIIKLPEIIALDEVW